MNHPLPLYWIVTVFAVAVNGGKAPTRGEGQDLEKTVGKSKKKTNKHL